MRFLKVPAVNSLDRPRKLGCGDAQTLRRIYRWAAITRCDADKEKEKEEER